MCKRVISLTAVCFIIVCFVGSSFVRAAIDRETIMGLWLFEDPGAATDSGPYGFHGTLSGVPQFKEGPVGNAIYMDGVDDGVTINSPTEILAINDVITVTFWLQLSNPDGWPSLVKKDRIGGIAWACDSHSSRGLRVRMDTSGGNNNVSWMADGDPTWQDGQWHHVGWVINTGEVTGYFDGEKIGGGTYPHGDGFATTQGNLTFGPLQQNAVTAFDEIGIFSAALEDDDIMAIYTSGLLGALGGKKASNPNPADEAVDAPRQVELGWSSGQFATQHDVYFGTSFDDVNNATTTVDPAGVYKGRQLLSGYVVGEVLDFGQTYFWRIDEVNSAPDLTIFEGDVWSFTVEPYAVPVPGGNITVSASSFNSDTEGPENTINGSGMDVDNLHSSESKDMWLSDILATGKTWIQYEFDKVYKLHQMRIWNYNSTVEPAVGFGIKDATIEYSADGANWSILGTTHEFADGSGQTGYGSNTSVDFASVSAQYVKITANSNWKGYVQQYGLSEVRFDHIPVWAREPSPDSGATDVSVNSTLSWKAGREASEHNVYLSTDEQAVIDGTAPVITLTDAAYSPSLDLDSTYFWRVDEANDTQTPASWPGDVWSLSTQEYLAIDDFESYNDIPAGEEGSNLVYIAWVDGFDNPSANGSTMGYVTGASMETDKVHGGDNSVPFEYNNVTAGVSEVVRTFTTSQDWTAHGIITLSLWFAGDAANVPGQLYVKINGVQIDYDGDMSNLAVSPWQVWNIDLATVNTNLSNVTSLAIGVQGPGATGTLLLDDIRLYAKARELVTPIDPGSAGLQGHWQFDGTANDSSGNGHHGVAMGNPMFVAGKTGQAIGLNGIDQYVTITGYKGILADTSGVQQPFTVAAWVKTVDDGDRTIASWGTNTSMLRLDFRLYQGRLRVEHGGGNVQGDTALNNDEWHHVALTMIQGATISNPDVQLWLDGKDDTRPGTDADAFSITADVDMAIGYRATAAGRYFFGAIDDVRLYNRTLSSEEVAGLAGLTKPFDKPF